MNNKSEIQSSFVSINLHTCKVLWRWKVGPAPPDFRELSSLKEPLLTILLMDICICIEYKSGNRPQDRKERGRGSEIKWKSKETSK